MAYPFPGVLHEFLQRHHLYGGNHAALTEAEARLLLGAKTLDAARDRIAAAVAQGNGESVSGILQEAAGQVASSEPEPLTDGHTNPEERPDLYDWQDCIDTPFRDPRESPGFESLPDHLKQALDAGARRSRPAEVKD
jgi:hypothetical protein